MEWVNNAAGADPDCNIPVAMPIRTGRPDRNWEAYSKQVVRTTTNLKETHSLQTDVHFTP